MPDPQDPESDQNDGSVGNSTIQEMRKQIKELRDAAKASQAAVEAAQAQAAEKDALLAGFQRAQIFDQLNIAQTGPGKLFRDAYQGELTAEAVKAKAMEYDLIKPAEQSAPTIPGVDANAMQRMMAALPGSQQSTSPPNAMEAINGAKSTTELMGLIESLGLTGNT